MIFDVAISEVQQILGWRSDRATEIGNALKYAQSEREKPGMTYPWFLRSVGTISTVAGTQEYSIPSDYIQDTEEKEGNLFIYSGGTSLSRTIFLRKLDFEEAQKKYFGTWPADDRATISNNSDVVPPGVPVSFVLEPTTVRFYPTPNAVYVVNWRYWGAAATLTSGQENAWLKNAPWVLIGDAAKKLGADIGNAQAVATATEILGRAEQNLFRATIHREEAGKRRYMGRNL